MDSSYLLSNAGLRGIFNQTLLQSYIENELHHMTDKVIYIKTKTGNKPLSQARKKVRNAIAFLYSQNII